METMESIAASFSQYIQQIGYSKTSQYQICSSVKEFLAFVSKANSQEQSPRINNITQQDILNFYQYLQTRPLKRRAGVLSQTMIQHYLYGLKTFFSWLEQTQHLRYNPMSNLKFKRPENTPREPLSQQQIKKLFKTATTAKQRAILHLFYSCGLRRTEAENLNTSDIHFGENLLYVRQGKGAKRRVIPINERVKKDLEHYYNTERTKTNHQAFMLNRTNERMSGQSYNKALKELTRASKIDKPTTLHHLRHSIATHLLENGLSIEFVRDFLGHSHLEATQIYAKVRAKQLKHL
ncbi:MAG: hypothetical protein CFE24_07120 [Flavobacterium sp. BFFFF2]|nr:MAG: hypothetical protein CFE24_07120 [Flavobacterium sp. BFFFF2]